MTDAPVTVDRNDSTVILSIDHPEERNSLSAPVADVIVDELDAVGETTTRAVLLRSTGDSFCAGGDVGAHVGRVEGDLSAAAWRERVDRTAAAVAALHECPVPTVAAVDGPAFNEGACLALACDIRLANPDAAIGFGFRRFGQAAAAGATYLLPRVVGADVAADLLFTGRLVDAREATDRGLFTRLVSDVPLADEAASLLSTLATGPPAGLQATKRLLRADHGSLDDALDAERAIQRRLAETEAFREGVRAFTSQRDPDFT